MIAGAATVAGTALKHWTRTDMSTIKLATVTVPPSIGSTNVADKRLRLLSAVLCEVGVVMALYSLWMYSSRIPRMGVGDAIKRGRWVVDVQERLFIPSEKVVQKLILPFPWIVKTFNVYYLIFHVPALVFTLFWIFIAHRECYSLLRNSVALTTLMCLLLQLVPVAPPRMLTDLGYVDTALKYGQSVYGILGRGGLAGQVSAMPSVHVAWAAIVAYFGVKANGRRFTKVLALTHGITTFVVVAATANHFWLDGIVAIAFLAISVILLRQLTKLRRSLSANGRDSAEISA
jgi:PAP2 superfamily